MELWIFDVASGEGRALTAGWERWPTCCGPGIDDGRALIVDRGRRRARSRCSASPSTTGAVERVTAAESGGSHEQIALIPGSDAIAGLRHRFTHPPEPFRCDLRAGAKPELLARLSGFARGRGLGARRRRVVHDGGRRRLARAELPA